VRSVDFPKYAAVRFKNQDRIDTLYWLEFIFETKLSFDNNRIEAEIKVDPNKDNTKIIDVKTLNKYEILNRLAEWTQIIIFKKNQRLHAKVHKVLGAVDENEAETCVIIMDINHADANDFGSMSIIMQPVDEFKHKMDFTHKERNDFILNNKVQSKLTEKFEMRYKREKNDSNEFTDVLDEKVNETYANTKKAKIAANIKLTPFQAGIFDRFAHKVRRVGRHFKAPRDRSVSRTTTFSRINDHPEELDDYHKEENDARIAQLENIKNEEYKTGGALQRFLKERRKAKAIRLLSRIEKRQKPNTSAENK